MATGCAEERDPINRVQANALSKSFFVGDKLADTSDDPEFWTQATIIDVGYGASQSGLFTSTYTQAVARIKWQITEDLLLGRLTYERIADSDNKGVGPSDSDGQVVVAYRISKHFDIRRAYNPSTGEELNVVEENASDRLWNEREYFRVDWSKNLNTEAYDFDTLSLLGVYGGVSYQSLAYYVNDPNDADAPFFDVENGYFDVTNKAFATPGLIDLSHLGWGIDTFPACFLPNDILGGSEPAGNCNPTELTVRQAFRRVVDTDYEPADWDGYRFQSYGGFYTERYGYARNYGMADSKWHRFLTRYNVWQRSHAYGNSCKPNSDGSPNWDCINPKIDKMEDAVQCYVPFQCDEETPDFGGDAAAEYEWRTEHCRGTPFGEDPHRDNDQNGTEDECEWVTRITGFPGSRCDAFKQRCTLPYRLRQPRQLAWYFTNDSAQDYWQGTEWATHDHDVAMRSAMAVARYAECRATGGDKEGCTAAYPVYFGQMDDHLEVKQLSREVDDCRHGVTYPDVGAVNSQKREDFCVGLADSISAARAGQNRPFDTGVVEIAKAAEQIVLCHSPVEANDPPICAPADERLPAGITAAACNKAYQDRSDSELIATCRAAKNVRRGDLRHHLVNVMNEPQTPSPWGIYTDAEDPLTGETFSAAINVWAHVNDLWSQIVIDRVRYIKGELATEDVTDGRYVKDWAQAAKAASGGQGMAPRMSRDQVNKRIADFSKVSPKALQKMTKNFDVSAYGKVKKLRNEIRGVRASLNTVGSMRPIYESRRKTAQATEFEAELVDPMMMQYIAADKLPSAGFALDQASVLRRLNPTVQKELRNMYQSALAERGTCVFNQAPAPMAMTGLADSLEAKFGKFDPTQSKTEQQFRAERMRKYIAQRAHYAVIVHEMGHSVGERHNFVSSSDAYNYRPQYWQLRTNDGQVSERCGCDPNAPFSDQTCGNYVADGSQCLGPRYYDPQDENERKNMIWMWMHSSVMDYAGEYTQDFLGLASYDFAAHRMFYGETVAVFDDPGYAVGNARASGMISKMDSFGGILGIQPEFDGEDIHYTQIQKNYEVIKDCQPLSQEQLDAYRPASWNEETQGTWDPTLDGFIVTNASGQYTKCRQQKVDYVPWQSLHFPAGTELNGVGFYRGGPSIDKESRIRVPYGFATDRWADLGNASVYRHDNGADVYEIFDFLLTQQEVHHIFDNYRRGRQTFSVRSASGRTLGRYNEKVRDAAKGLGLLANIYRDFAAANNWVFDGGYWGFISNLFFRENILVSGMAFDHFVRTFARPEVGSHYREGGVLLSEEDSYANNTISEVLIPNGASGYYGNITAGGKLVENRLSEDQGEFDSNFTMNAGSYYDKVWAPYLMTESEDNFISDSRSDFVDGRYRAVSLADLFPDGFRRWMANSLTNDKTINGAWLAASASGSVLVDSEKFPAWPIGFTTWWTDQPEVCFPAEGTNICTAFGGDSSNFDPRTPDNVVPLSGQIGWNQQKFLIAMTLLYLPANQRDDWLNQIAVWQLGTDPDPAFANRIEFHDPNGKIYVAKRMGKETIFGKTVERGIAARVLEYANSLLVQAYETDPGPDLDNDQKPDWYIPRVDPGTGKINVLHDSTMQFVDEASGTFVNTIPGCDGNDKNNGEDNTKCPCSANLSCKALNDYAALPNYLRQALDAYNYDISKQGIYD